MHLWKKTLHKVGIEGNYLNIINAICDKPTANIIINGESISSKIKSKTRISILVTLIQHGFGSSGHNEQTGKIRGIQIGKEGVKLSVFADDMMLYKVKRLPEIY